MKKKIKDTELTCNQMDKPKFFRQNPDLLLNLYKTSKILYESNFPQTTEDLKKKKNKFNEYSKHLEF